MTKKLGRVQKEVLRTLRYHGSYPKGWVWGTHSQTKKVLESLVKRGLVRYSTEVRDGGVYQTGYVPVPLSELLPEPPFGGDPLKVIANIGKKTS